MNQYHPLLAEITTLPWVAIIAVGGGILLTIVIIIGGLIIAHHRQKFWHETARLALEKGHPLPAPLDASTADKDQPYNPASDIRTGLIMIATGAGLYLFFLSLFNGWMKFVGAIPGFIGVALLLYGSLHALFGRKSPSRPPQT
ncbi:MAG TPA: DUF6249 domain-containing protein [Lacunisphaera sp.]|nr:DUF6249 domain-containing protein [Lacunisphaera sp.]